MPEEHRDLAQWVTLRSSGYPKSDNSVGPDNDAREPITSEIRHELRCVRANRRVTSFSKTSCKACIVKALGQATIIVHTDGRRTF